MPPAPLKHPVNQIPYKETRELAHKHEDYGPGRFAFVEAQRYSENIANKRNPASQGKPYAVFVDIDLLLLKGLRLDLEPFLKPLPSGNPAHPVGDYAAYPVAERAYYKTPDSIPSRGKNRNIERIRAERKYCGSQKSADKKAEKAERCKVHVVPLKKIALRKRYLQICGPDRA